MVDKVLVATLLIHKGAEDMLQVYTEEGWDIQNEVCLTTIAGGEVIFFLRRQDWGGS